MLPRLTGKSPRLARAIKEFEVQFKWLLTWMVFFVLRRGWRPHGGQLDVRRVGSVLFLRYDRIGDMIVSLPTFHALKRNFPHLEIDVLASPANRMLVSHDPSISEVLLYDKGSFARTWQTIRRLRRKRYDVTIDLLANVSATSLFILLLAGKDGFKIGVRKNNSIGLYDFIIPEHQLRTTPAVELHFSALIPFGLKSGFLGADPGIQLSDQQWRRGSELIDRIRLPGYTGLIGINISAGKPNRAWGVERYRALTRELSGRYAELQFLLFSAPTEYDSARTIATAGGTNVAVIPPNLSLLDVIAMMKHLDLIMTPDTSICHVASSLGIPLLGLYTAAEENFQRWKPWHSPSWVLRPAAGDSLEGITLEAYLAKADEALQVVCNRSVAG